MARPGDPSVPPTNGKCLLLALPAELRLEIWVRVTPGDTAMRLFAASRHYTNSRFQALALTPELRGFTIRCGKKAVQEDEEVCSAECDENGELDENTFSDPAKLRSIYTKRPGFLHPIRRRIVAFFTQYTKAMIRIVVPGLSNWMPVFEQVRIGYWVITKLRGRTVPSLSAEMDTYVQSAWDVDQEYLEAYSLPNIKFVPPIGEIFERKELHTWLTNSGHPPATIDFWMAEVESWYTGGIGILQTRMHFNMDLAKAYCAAVSNGCTRDPEFSTKESWR
ncbi:hypothetical protein BU23DRAFT_647486 [Bimuria novae-zelandiae CBS 107.79]|uniref:Uncharacterized protein n=1 Tax=Bimuria novae-zelandiae CBS 107.79 TaxID=1447943 RepID=A0A6A5VPM7_9PLEO|nr:hypothetical protein BU23DRAFT_647486 [Bimuria novae-zelandiae CBS 107.79]